MEQHRHEKHGREHNGAGQHERKDAGAEVCRLDAEARRVIETAWSSRRNEPAPRQRREERKHDCERDEQLEAGVCQRGECAELQDETKAEVRGFEGFHRALEDEHAVGVAHVHGAAPGQRHEGIARLPVRRLLMARR